MNNLPVLEIGEESVLVYVMQAALNYWSYHCPMTGRFDEKTFMALRRFREAHYIKGDTVCDKKTWECLLFT